MTFLSLKIKNMIFFSYYSLVIILLTFPGAFDWANRIEPQIIGIPFSIFYVVVLVGLLSAGTIVQYRVEDKRGELDIEIEETDIHKTNNSDEGDDK